MAALGEIKWVNGQYVRANGGRSMPGVRGDRSDLFEVSWVEVDVPKTTHRERTMSAEVWDALPASQSEEVKQLNSRIDELERRLEELSDIVHNVDHGDE